MTEKNRVGFGGFLRSRQGVVLVIFLVIAGYFLWTEHRAHLIGTLSWLPWLLVLACPLLHVFMHGSHGGHGGHGNQKDHDHQPTESKESER